MLRLLLCPAASAAALVFLIVIVVAADAAWCPCDAHRNRDRCTPALLRFRPHDGTPMRSYITADGGPFSVVINRPMPPTIVQAVAARTLEGDDGGGNATGDGTGLVVDAAAPQFGAAFLDIANFVAPLLGVDSQFTLTAAAVSSDPSVIITGGASAAAHCGEFALAALQLSGAAGASGFFNFTLERAGAPGTVLAWLRSPTFTLRIDPQAGTSTPTFHLRFQPFFSHFIPTLALNDAQVVVGVPLPEIVVEVVDAADGLSTSLTGQLATVRGVYLAQQGNLTLENAAVELRGATARFVGLTVAASGTVTNAEFRLLFSAGPLLLHSHTLRAARTKSPNHRLGFGGAGESFVTHREGPLFAAVGVPLPRVVVYLLDNTGGIDTTSTGSFVSVRSHGAVLNGSRAAFHEGRAVFEDLIFAALRNEPAAPRNFVLTFAAGSQQRLRAEGRPLFSPPIVVYPFGAVAGSPVALRLRRRFGFIRYPTQPLMITRDVHVPPIVVEQIGADNHVLASWPGEVRLTSTPEDAVRGATSALLVDGVATFEGVFFSSRQDNLAVTLHFSAAGLPTLVAGPIMVVSSVVREALLRFDSSPFSLFSQEHQEAFATAGAPLPPIVVEILNSDGEVDRAANEVVVTASSQALPAEGLVAIAHHGRAVFDSITFTVPGAARLAFTARSTRALSAATPLHTLRLMTGLIAVEPERTERFRLTFSRSSYVHHEGEEVVATRGFPLPPIGVLLVGSDHQPSGLGDADARAAAPVNVQVECAAVTSSGDGEVLAVVDFNASAGGVAWFDGVITFGAAFSGREVRLRFTARHRPVSESSDVGAPAATAATQRSLMSSPAIGTSLTTGLLTFVGASPPLLLRIPPQLEPWVRESLPPTDVLISDSARSNKYFYPSKTTFSFAVEALNGGLLTTLPTTDAGTTVTAATSVPLARSNASFEKDERPARPPTSVHALFSGLALQGPLSHIEGMFYTVAVTAAWGSLQYRPLHVGPFLDLTEETDEDQPVVVAEVLDRPPSFSLPQWLAAVATAMNLDASRIEVVRVRFGGTAEEDFDYRWLGMRIELRFLPPTTASKYKASSRDLADLFVSLTDEDADLDALKLRGKFHLRDRWRECDLFRIEEQIEAAKRCVATSPAAARCECHVPIFRAFGERCKHTGPVFGVCSQLRRCTNTAIEGPCRAFERQVYLQYIVIAVYVVLAAAGGYSLWAWRTGRFARAKRRKLGNAEKTKHGSATAVLPTDDGSKALDVVL